MTRSFHDIVSKDNPHYRGWMRLRTRKGRAAGRSCLVEGVRSIRSLLDAGGCPSALIVSADASAADRVRALLDDSRLAGVTVYRIPDSLFKALSRQDTPQGIAAEIAIPDPPDWRAHPWKGVAVLADNLRDPRNLGLLLRTADAAGADALFLSSGSADPWHPETLAASMGSVFNLPVYPFVPALDLIDAARRSGVCVAAAVGQGSADVFSWAPTAALPVLLVVGNEGSGLSEEILKTADVTVAIPIHGKAESLNVAVAAGLLCYLVNSAPFEGGRSLRRPPARD